MTAAVQFEDRPANPGWLKRAEAWLDERGRPAWLVAMVLGFIFFWPVGLGLLGYMIWSKRMFGTTCRKARNATYRQGFNAMKPSGNSAFDAYKADTLKRLEDEQKSFEDFLGRLRDARDKAEFDQFMDERARKARDVKEEEDA
ncbi:hypothetical protein GCM10011415_04800 [Salipiger pallidus]|uniref:DUF2852 domain-containing protein n=1 Tax=Salipiger pallidus TaxID=1775170 RepID=A0A8J2ZH23_9RHOB|nr:DUF2852 domain-containing protein [Salipiger pallidus]GGG61686.1 hypothetical protein GCM10011415_04800 [Salipiger pallidus]